MRKIIKNKKAALTMLGSIVVLLSIMFATIIGAIIFFAFSDAAHVAQDHTETFNIADRTTAEILDLRMLPESGTVTVEIYNSSSAAWSTVPSANISITRDLVTVDSGVFLNADNDSVVDTNYTRLRASYHDMGYGITTTVILYAVIVFGMVALVPLIIIGGIMLRSLGFFGGGGSKAP